MSTRTTNLRCTSRLLALMGTKPSWVENPPPSDHDWYANMFWLDRKKCLLLTHSGTLFSVLAADIKKADITPIGPFISDMLMTRCAREGISPALVDVGGIAAPVIARTANKSVLAVMSQMQIEIGYMPRGHGGYERFDPDGWNHFLNRALRKRERDYTTPLDLVKSDEARSRRPRCQGRHGGSGSLRHTRSPLCVNNP